MDLIPFLLQGKQYNTIFIIVLFLNKPLTCAISFIPPNSFLRSVLLLLITLIHVPHAELRSHQFKKRVQLAELVAMEPCSEV